MKPQVAVQLTMDATVLEENYHRTQTALGHRLVDLLRVATASVALAAVAPWWRTVMLAAEVVAAGAPHTGLEQGRGRGHADSHITGVSRCGYNARRKIEEIQ
jgi:hypothetical protein